MSYEWKNPKSNLIINRYYFSCTRVSELSVVNQEPISLLLIQLHHFSQIFQTLPTVLTALRRDGHNLTTKSVTIIVLLDCMENWQQRTMTGG